MAICTKINTAGTTLQNNLNARGVSCTYGKNSESKQTIKDMADLITSSNLKGANDALISITANRPYLLSGETTDLTVRLVNGLGQPLANKSVSISDGSSSYSGITNSLGLFTLYDVTVSADTTFTATYSTVTDSILVELCDFVDYAVTSNKNTDWDNYSSRLTVATDTIGTTLTKGSSNGYYFVHNGATSYTDYIVEFDIVSVTNQAYWYMQGATSGTLDVINLANQFSTGGHCKITSSDGTIKVYKNGTQVGSDVTVTTVGNNKMGFRINSGANTPDRDIKFANFRLHTL